MTIEFPPHDPQDIFVLISEDPNLVSAIEEFDSQSDDNHTIFEFEMVTPTIEEVALEAWEDLKEVEKEISEELLNEKLNNGIIGNIIANNIFVFDYVIPPVFDLLQRSKQPVYLSEAEVVGFSYCYPQDKSKEEGVGFLVRDTFDNSMGRLEMPEMAQFIWDTGSRDIRADLKVFSELTRKQIFDRFYNYIQYYKEL